MKRWKVSGDHSMTYGKGEWMRIGPACSFGKPVTVPEFLARLPETIAPDAAELAHIFCDVTGHEPIMWGPAIVGYGETNPGAKPDCLCDGLEIGFAARPDRLFLYLRHYASYYEEFSTRLGNVHCGRACISFASLADVDRAVLRELLTYAWHG
ncbi:DUF1801 domain-containing protein [Arcanobacterium buesumense]|uniref:DUF1801 domain-containing protein n=1 Tax=Arcanobacterium buesumense TaxID=2722751 RepID=A0A6H2END2_9ACTO|nr:DUF1801 domain-containing protein [Arcanobacterium buesumense]QJC22574.1 DUF1801 domain-containing protein [Arcanobacterium buesumense]